MDLVAVVIGGKTAYYSLLGLVALEVECQCCQHRYRACLSDVWPADSQTLHLSREELWVVALNEVTLDETKKAMSFSC